MIVRKVMASVVGMACWMMAGALCFGQGDERPADGPRPMEARHPPMGPMDESPSKRFMEQYDANHDGKVERNEYPGPPALFKLLDKNGDGSVGPDDLKALHARMESREALANPIPLTKAFDKDGDGLLGPDEWPTFTQALQKLDKNQDGKLSPNELRGEPTPPMGAGMPREVMERMRRERGAPGQQPGFQPGRGGRRPNDGEGRPRQGDRE